MSSYDSNSSSNDSCGSSRHDTGIYEYDWIFDADDDDLLDFSNEDRSRSNAVRFTPVLEYENREEMTMDPDTRNKKLPNFYEKDCICMPCRPIFNACPKNSKGQKMSEKAPEKIYG